MKKDAPTVRCTYTDTGESLDVLLEKTFRSFLIRAFTQTTEGSAFTADERLHISEEEYAL